MKQWHKDHKGPPHPLQILSCTYCNLNGHSTKYYPSLHPSSIEPRDTSPSLTTNCGKQHTPVEATTPLKPLIALKIYKKCSQFRKTGHDREDCPTFPRPPQIEARALTMPQAWHRCPAWAPKTTLEHHPPVSRRPVRMRRRRMPSPPCLFTCNFFNKHTHPTYMCLHHQQVQAAHYARVHVARQGFLDPTWASPYPEEEDLVAPPNLVPSDDEIDKLFKQ